MPKDICYGKTLRKSFARSTEIQDMPNLLEIQKKSYKWFLDTGLREVFRDVDRSIRKRSARRATRPMRPLSRLACVSAIKRRRR